MNETHLPSPFYFDEFLVYLQIERLCDRLQLATRTDDRRDAVRGLKSLSKRCKLEVATQSMTLLANTLQGDRTDLELIQLVLETLANVITFEPDNSEEQANLPQDITIQFTELFIKTKEHVHAALELVEETDFNLRRAAIGFLTVLLTNCTKTLQEIILESGPMGVSKLVDLLQDEREVIRNDALLLLQILTRSNANIQKIVVFENGFERLFEILTSEGGSEGGVIVSDCLSVLLNLLRHNASNQSFFRESSYVRRLVGFFQLDSIGEQNWPTLKVTNVQLLLQVIRTLVSPTNANQTVASCQRTVNQCGLLHRLCVMLTVTGISADVLAETINTIGDTIRGNTENQHFFASVMSSAGDSQQSVLFSLLYTMVAGEKQSFSLRIAILYCVQCYLYKNDYGRSAIVQTLLPQQENASNQCTVGHLLIIGFLSKDTVASWCASTALAHLIADNEPYKEAILKVVLAIDQSQAGAKSLMEISLDLLDNPSSTLHTRMAVLMFLCTWLSHCPLAVQAFLSHSKSISYLISQICAPSVVDDRDMLVQSLCSFAFGLCLLFNNNQVPSYSIDSLERIINKRIGVELFQEKLEALSKSDCYAKTLQKPQLQCAKPNEMLLDYEFVRLYKSLEGSIMRKLTSPSKEEEEEKKTSTNAAMAQYHQMIQQQTQQLNAYQQQEQQFTSERESYRMKIGQLEQMLHDMQNQYSALKLTSEEGQRSDDALKTVYEQQQAELDYLRNMVAYQQQYLQSIQPVQLNEQPINQTNHLPQVDDTTELNTRLVQLQESLAVCEENDASQKAELARLQLENNILQEKMVNEKRKVAILEDLGRQMQELIEEKTQLNDEYQLLNVSYQKNLREQSDLFALCSSYEDQLRQCRTLMQAAGLLAAEP